jgi:drug/metabolite transporter (DMT)-like permease
MSNALTRQGEVHYKRVWIGLGLAVGLDVITPLVWKAAVMRLPGPESAWAALSSAFSQPLFAAVLGLILLQFFNWMAVLAESDVSYAQPITALSYVAVVILSGIIFGEKISFLRGLGIGLILVGVWLISTTPVLTVSASPRLIPRQGVRHGIHR